MSALDEQVGGDHYRKLAIQPVVYVHKNDIGYIEGSVIAYVTRWREKGGVEDLRKARHFLAMLIELESEEPEVAQAKWMSCQNKDDNGDSCTKRPGHEGECNFIPF